MRLFRRQGYSATGLGQVLEESGAPKGSLYHYFPGGKEDLGAAAVQAASAVVSKTLTALAATASSSSDFLAEYCRLLAGWLEQSSYRDGCPIATTLLETVPESELITKVAKEGLDDWIRIVAEVYQRDGLDADASRREAITAIAAIEGALLLARVLKSTEPFSCIAGKR